jgi:hypothetical protein
MSEKNTEMGIVLTAGQLRAVLDSVPDDAKVYYERIEDEYFDSHGWVAVPLANDAWYERAGFECEEDHPEFPGEWIEVYEAFYNKEENALKITAHF